jgi:hypothetical protein
MKGCRVGGGNSKTAAQIEEEKAGPKVISRPKALMCYICGREYGTTSLEIHLKACRKKWEIEQEKKPVAQRRPCPDPPKDFDQAISGAKSGTYDF